jgi:FSR family fosmidomycin resistance protein-like MFS transporter
LNWSSSVIPRSRVFWSVSWGHFVIDMFNASVAVILAFLSGHLIQMTNTQIGIAISIFQIMGSLSQPLCGWLADRSGGRWLGAGGVAWTLTLMALALVVASVTHSFLLMMLPLMLAALGSGAFHPVGAMHAAETDRTRTTSNLAIFFLMGSIGGGLGPIITGVLLDRASTHNNVFTAALGPLMAGRLLEHGSITPILIFILIGVPAAVFMALAIPGAHAHKAHALSNKGSVAISRGRVALLPLLLLGTVITLRGFINPGLVSFLPAMFQARGWSPSEYGLITGLYWIGGGVMGVVFGQLADRIGSRLLIVASLLLSAPAVWGLTVSNGPLALILALAVGAFSGGAHSLIVAMAQRVVPVGKGLASGAVLGFIFGMGALAVLVIGAVADRIGLDATFQIIAVIGVITGVLALLLPQDRPVKQVEADVIAVEEAAAA